MSGNSGLEFIPTKGSMLKKSNEIQFKTTVFNSHKSKRKEGKETSDTVIQANTDEFNIKKAKHEVLKFGMSGLDPEKKHEAKVQLAIKLGAKPPKNKYKNYKLLIKERAKEKLEVKEKVQFQQLGKNVPKKTKGKSKIRNKNIRDKAKSGLLDVYGKITPKN